MFFHCCLLWPQRGCTFMACTATFVASATAWAIASEISVCLVAIFYIGIFSALSCITASVCLFEIFTLLLTPRSVPCHIEDILVDLIFVFIAMCVYIWLTICAHAYIYCGGVL